jgi:hypothetical protein
MCGLNAEHLAREREKRSKYRRLLKETPLRVKCGFEKARELFRQFRAEVELMITPIPALPDG